ncbi:AraC family transcriptional regulator [Sporolactobacillus sp. STSJ-5]|uniref:AraC family transcriptional regulator n=1 Tax=Sporolactobacillus sp. STSJ-5 TaxID=2965076 RepID=UPI002105D419|nr:helix-turn-helix domain-containing protein [Sporolactobacillus sp. STSJ-5]MCQ2011551.1 AraC family transcriptional regulator [Sporolactobacillus sp. STSJ-5]
MKSDLKHGENFKRHWHEHLQLYYFMAGRAVLECGHKRFNVSSGNIALVNSNELHFLESLSDDLKCYIIRINPSFLFSNQVDLLQTKYLTPLALNQITFQNLIERDEQFVNCVTRILREHVEQEIGYGLAIKGLIYQIVVLLLRGHVDKILTKKELEIKKRTLKRFDDVFQIIENSYDEKISLGELAEVVSLSTSHFCRTFKQVVGKTTTDYINGVRLEHAVSLLEQTSFNITEIALKCGFDSVNYFSRLFKRYYSTSPTEYRVTHSGQSSL